MKKIFFISVALTLCSISVAQTWTQKAQFPGIGRWTAFGFSIGTKGYVCGGYDGNLALNDLWEWDQANNTWAQKANMPVARFAHSGFVLSGNAYIGIGEMDVSGNQYNDWWEYNPISNIWIQKANFSAGYRGYTEFFSIGTKGYLCTGLTFSPVTYQNDLWEYDAGINSWTQKANFPGNVRAEGISFVSNGIAYFGMGKFGNTSYNDIWKWDPNNNTWAQVTTFPGSARIDPATITLCGKIFFISGWLASQNATTKEVWMFDPAIISWTQLSNFPGASSLDQAYFEIGNKGYIATGYDYSNPPSQELWEFAPSLINLSVASNTSICIGGSTTLIASGGVNYSWNNGATTTSIVVSPSTSTTYSVFSSSYCGLDTAAATVTITNVALDPGNTMNICLGDTAQLAAGGNAASYTWSPVGSLSNPFIISPQAFPTVTTTYTVVGTNAIGCTAIDSQMIIVHPLPLVPVISQNLNTLTSSSGNSYQWYFNSSILLGDTMQSLFALQSGSYQVMITDSNGCSAISAPFSFVYNSINENDYGIFFSVSPNPFNSEASIQISNTKYHFSELELKMYDIFGKEVKNQKITNSKQKLERGNLVKGIYFVELRRNGTIVGKLKVAIE